MKSFKVILISFIVFIIGLTSICTNISKAATTSTAIEPTDSQYLELKATTISEVNGTKQVIMELWGYDINFKRI